MSDKVYSETLPQDVEIPFDVLSLSGITQDSRKVKDGYAFFALDGVHVKGSDYIPQAIENGAKFIVAGEDVVRPDADVEFYNYHTPALMLAMACAKFYAPQPDIMVAVTGTNGKSSVVHFVRQLWTSMGVKSASLGTLGLEGDGISIAGNMTTPEPVTLHEVLREVKQHGIEHVAMEASSHGLEQKRMHGVYLKAAGFTNLTQDHLDYHGTMEAYADAKSKLFGIVLPPDGFAVINADDPSYRDISKGIKLSRMLTYGRSGKEIRLISCMPSSRGQDVRISVFGEEYSFSTSLAGQFQVMNMLCALGMVMVERFDDVECINSLVAALPRLKTVPGRLQAVEGHPNGAGIYVDYAHTPDALETVLNALRPHVSGRLVALFGCGGDRDTGKRPMMGEIAERLADHVIVTDDNPRSEDPAQIRNEILQDILHNVYPEGGAVHTAVSESGVREISPGTVIEEIGGRAEAIEAAIKGLKDGDILVIAGKGHEQGQIFADRTEPFCDVEEARKAIGYLHNEKV